VRVRLSRAGIPRGTAARLVADFRAQQGRAQAVSTAQLATIVNLGFILGAFLCGLALPRTLGAERAGENR
jgi:hypothetical protein